MPDSKIVDAWALLAWLRDEQPAADSVRRTLQEAEDGIIRLSMSWINAGEVFADPTPARLKNANLCPVGEYCIYEEAGPNPYAAGGEEKWSKFQSQFVSACEARKVTGGPTPTSVCGYAAGYFGPVAYCDCCEHCEGK
jgi:hypothetical protein